MIATRLISSLYTIIAVSCNVLNVYLMAAKIHLVAADYMSLHLLEQFQVSVEFQKVCFKTLFVLSLHGSTCFQVSLSLPHLIPEKSTLLN